MFLTKAGVFSERPEQGRPRPARRTSGIGRLRARVRAADDVAPGRGNPPARRMTCPPGARNRMEEVS